jgi:hypothetical protein
VECKSYLDSVGVRIGAFNGAEERFAKRFKLFNDRELFRVVRNRLVRQLVGGGFCAPSPRVTLCLAAGRIASEAQRVALVDLFRQRRWLLLDDAWLKRGLARVAEGGYQNDIASVVAKLIMRPANARLRLHRVDV